MGNVKAKPQAAAAAQMAKSLLVAYEDHVKDFYETLADVRAAAEELMQEYLYIESYYPSGLNLSGLPVRNPVTAKKKEFFNNIGGAVWTKGDIATIQKAMLKMLDEFEVPLEKVLGK